MSPPPGFGEQLWIGRRTKPPQVFELLLAVIDEFDDRIDAQPLQWRIIGRV
jgi:hypothetical protein